MFDSDEDDVSLGLFAYPVPSASVICGRQALRYLNLVNDYQQYLAARCAMGDIVVMYQVYKGAARKKRAYDGGDGAVAVTKEDVVDVVRKTYKGAARKKRADDAGDGAVAFRRSNRAK